MSKSSHPALVWPRTDGDPSKYPETIKGSDSWYEEEGVGTAKYELYASQVAKHLVNHLGLNVDASKQRIPLPEGYKIFAHKKAQSSGEVRTDHYVYGARDVAKFRSVPEFLDHAEWLFDTSRPLDDHTTCTCKYSKGTNRRQSMPSSATKRPSGSSPLKEGSAKKKKVEPREEAVFPAVVPERAEELRSHRRFRRGELIWFRINTIDPPSHAPTPGLRPVTHWPGLISNILLKMKVLNSGDVASASASSAWTLFGGQAPTSLDSSNQTVIHYYEYHIRPLGMFSAQDEIIKDGRDVLPWQAGSDLMGGEPGWNSIGLHAEKVLKEGVKKEGAKHKGSGQSQEELESLVNKGWKGNWAKRIRFLEMSDKYEEIVFRLSVALKIGSDIAEAWAQTDKIDVLPNDQDISAEDMKAILSQKKNLYQGLWWGGERIWLDDLVRLKKTRNELPTNALLSPSEGATERGVFLKIRVLAVEVHPDPSKPNTTGWRCVVYGDVFELAKEGTPGTESLKEANGDTDDTSLVHHYPAPKGYDYRQLNEKESEVTVDIIDVAGRIYPDLLDASTQNWFIDPSNPSNKEGRVEPGEGAYALSGLKSGTTVASKCTIWDEDLYSIVQRTTKATENGMKEWYIKLSRAALGLPKLPTSQVDGNPTGAANGHKGQNGVGTLNEVLNGSNGESKS
ncbi:hypothetical protein V865_003595 [Kwoniella europaea PYCC6329]|uniref:Cryptic loci regulator 2 N-terminal domain-containing protein n=1 Tax=Kwoniella europaea PYCC6329 TaxID=1423913 RepID=A0AAX4KGG2_9TREE